MNNLAIGRREERVPEEDRNIIIEKAYLYTITLEDDNDLHLLIGNTPVYDKDVTRVFNAEIAAIPPDGTTEEKEMIREVRRIVIAIITCKLTAGSQLRVPCFLTPIMQKNLLSAEKLRENLPGKFTRLKVSVFLMNDLV